MDPHRNAALNDAKLQTVLQSSLTSRSSDTTSSTEDMPAPPAYHSIVDPNAPIPNMSNPYDPEEDLEEDKEEDETPEININAATQVRGSGNIISITQMDSVRTANLIATMLHGGPIPAPSTPQSPQQPHTLPSLASMTAEPRSHKYPKVNITVNCGATVIGDRNIVGPGLGDIARQMQVAQRNAALQAQQQMQAKGAAVLTVPSRETLYQAQASVAQHHGVPSPPMSRSSSLQSEAAGVKRKAEEDVEGAVKRQC